MIMVLEDFWYKRINKIIIINNWNIIKTQTRLLQKQFLNKINASKIIECICIQTYGSYLIRNLF